MTPSFLLGAGALTVATVCWGHIKSILGRVWGLMFIQVSSEDRTMAAVLEHYFWVEFRRSKGAFRFYEAQYMYVRPIRQRAIVGFEKLGPNMQLFWRGWIPVLAAFQSSTDTTVGGIKMTFIRGTIDPDALVLDAIRVYDERSKASPSLKIGGRYRVTRVAGMGTVGVTGGGQHGRGETPSFNQGHDPVAAIPHNRPLRWTQAEIGEPLPEGSPFRALSYDEDVEAAIQEAIRWSKSQVWYQERQIPWRRGWLLHGPPGTGKSSLVRAMAQELDYPVYLFDIATMTNRDFTEAWEQVLTGAPAVVLFEDFDSVFKGRENVSGMVGGLTFDCILNCISGVQASDGVFLIVTTNNLDHIDPAMASATREGAVCSRPGRIDRVIALGSPCQVGRTRIASRILSDFPDLIEGVVEAGAGETGAQFTERCATLALERFWKDQAVDGGGVAEKPQEYPNGTAISMRRKGPLGSMFPTIGHSDRW